MAGPTPPGAGRPAGGDAVPPGEATSPGDTGGPGNAGAAPPGDHADTPATDPVAGAAGGDPQVAELTAERDEYLDALQRVKAEFDNFKRRTERERQTVATNATARMAGELLAVLDSCEAALEQGAADVEPIYKSLVEVLSKEGLEVMAGTDVPFDPHLHEAVTHEPAEPGDDSAATVVETLRTGYAWNGQVLRPAMVRVRG